MFRTFRKVKLVKSNESDKIRSNPEGGKLASGEPDALKGASPVRRRLRHEVAYVFVVLDNHDATQCSAIGTLPG
jgi:hypothetical protein